MDCHSPKGLRNDNTEYRLLVTTAPRNDSTDYGLLVTTASRNDDTGYDRGNVILTIYN